MPTEPVRHGRADEQPRPVPALAPPPHPTPAEGRSASSHGLLVDGHVGRCAARAKDMAASEIRALSAVCRDLLGQAAVRGT